MMDWLELPGTRARMHLLVVFVATLGVLGAAAGCGDDGGPSGGDDDDDDVTLDAGTEDAGPDDEEDAGGGPASCVVGTACATADDCAGLGDDRTRTCIPETPGEIGLTIDPVRGLDEPIEVTDWVGGYCTSEGRPGVGCESNADCGVDADGVACGECVAAFDVTGNPITRCLDRCDPQARDNSSCRDGYECDWITGRCLPGCSDDLQCQIYREDTNGNGIIDPFNPIVNREGDQLVLDPNAEGAVCNTDTFRCDVPGNPAATAGEPCDRDSQCLENGTCLAEIETDGEFPGGYCTRFGCEDPARTCDDDDEICMAKDLGVDACLARCTVGAEADNPLLRLGVDGRALDCRRNYRCAWDGVSDDQGGCLPGNYNAIPEESANLGETCGALDPAPIGLEDGNCWSPFGAGVCIGRTFRAMDPSNPVARSAWTACALRDCFAPGIAETCTAQEGACIELANTGRGEPSNSLCLPTCEEPADCPPFPGDTISAMACNETFRSGVSVCHPSCLDRRGEPDSGRCADGLVCNEDLGGICTAP